MQNLPYTRQNNFRWSPWSGWTPCEDKDQIDYERLASRYDKPKKPAYRNCYTKATRQCMNHPFGPTHQENCEGKSVKLELCDYEFSTITRCRGLFDIRFLNFLLKCFRSTGNGEAGRG